MTVEWDIFSYFLIVVVSLYILFDVNYFLRNCFTIGWSRLFNEGKKAEDTTTIYGICTTQDVGFVISHMNNARFERELDVARFHFIDSTGIRDHMSNKFGYLQLATNIRFRRGISLLDIYKITTKIIYWDEKHVYLEQQFVTLRDGFVRVVALSKGSIGVNVAEVIAKSTGKDVSYRPTPPEELTDWLSSIEKSSERLRKKN